jgi:hypothetical protein
MANTRLSGSSADLFSEIDPVIRRLAAGETLFAAGDETRGFFRVREGRVRLVRFGTEGRETALFTAGPANVSPRPRSSPSTTIATQSPSLMQSWLAFPRRPVSLG